MVKARDQVLPTNMRQAPCGVHLGDRLRRLYLEREVEPAGRAIHSMVRIPLTGEIA